MKKSKIFDLDTKEILDDGTVADTKIEMSALKATWHQGNVEVSYGRLVSVFGLESSDGDGFKTDAEWIIKTPSGIATIYNWKDGKNYLGRHGLTKDKISDWHIGGRTPKVVDWIRKVLA